MMRSLSRPAVFAAGALLALAVVPTSSAVASGGSGRSHDHHDGLLLRSSMAGSLVGEKASGADAGGAPWVIDEGSARVSSSGRVKVELEGLIIPALKSNPVAMVTVSLGCNGAVVSTSPSFPLSPAGDAEIETRLMVPARCIAPVVMVNPAGRPLVFIAISGQEA